MWLRHDTKNDRSQGEILNPSKLNSNGERLLINFISIWWFLGHAWEKCFSINNLIPMIEEGDEVGTDWSKCCLYKGGDRKMISDEREEIIIN